MVSDEKSLYVFGGCGSKGRLNDLWKFDLESSSWSMLPLNTAIAGRGGPSLGCYNGKICITTGFTGHENNDIHLFDQSTGQWTLVAENASFRPRSVAAHCTIGNYLFVFGGEVAASALGHMGARF